MVSTEQRVVSSTSKYLGGGYGADAHPSRVDTDRGPTDQLAQRREAMLLHLVRVRVRVRVGVGVRAGVRVEALGLG